MGKRKTDFKVPYKNGQLQHYARTSSFGDPEYGYPGEEWLENKPFRSTLILLGMNPGPYTKSVIWIDPLGNRYPMFLIDLVDTVKRADIQAGEVTSDWIVSRRGNNYGIRVYEGD